MPRSSDYGATSFRRDRRKGACGRRGVTSFILFPNGALRFW